jgi:hypothetical protein
MNDSQFILVWPIPGDNKALGFAPGGYKEILRDLLEFMKVPKLQLGSFEDLATDGRPGDWIMLFTPNKRTILVVKVM